MSSGSYSSIRLPNSALTEYNGVQLTEYTSTDGISIRPKKDSSNRVTIYNEYQFQFTTWFGAHQTDADILAIRQKLTEPGKPFQFNGRGFGYLFMVNVSRSGLQDVVWGPETTELAFDLFGPDATRVMRWTFMVRISDCPNARFTLSGRVVEYNTEISHQPTKTGLTRTITGHVVIPNNRGGVDGRQARDSADEWRDRVLPPMLPGFDREFDNFTLSEDRSRLDWSVRDIEFGLNVPPKYVIEPPRVSHSVKPVGGKGLAAWVGTLTGTYKLAKTAPDKYWPVKHFFGVLVRDRVGSSAEAMLRNPDDTAKAETIVPVYIGIEDSDIYGPVPTYNLSFSWTFSVPFMKLLSRTPMWQAVPNPGGWKEWQLSLRDTILSPYGAVQVRFRATEDRMTNLCDQGSIRAASGPRLFQDSVLRSFQDVALEALADVIPTPRPENSFLMYEQRLYAEIDGGLVPVTTLPEKKPKPNPNSLAAVVGAPILAAIGDLGAVPGGRNRGGSLDNQQRGRLVNEKNSPQRRRKDVLYVWLIGKATRAAYPIGCPAITEIQGSRAIYMPRTDQREGFTTWTGFNSGLFPINHAKWALRYLLPDGIDEEGVKVGPLVPPFNPLLDDSDG